MSVIEATERKPLNTEELLRRIEDAKQQRQLRTKTSTASRLILISIVALGALTIALGGILYAMKGEVTGMRTEISDLKNFKSQIAVVDPKLKIALLEAKVEDFDKDRSGIQDEITKVREEIETIKTSMTSKKGKR
jgi:hypothetical protein